MDKSSKFKNTAIKVTSRNILTRKSKLQINLLKKIAQKNFKNNVYRLFKLIINKVDIMDQCISVTVGLTLAIFKLENLYF